MSKETKKNLNRELRKKRNRSKLFGTPERPRLAVFRSNRYTYAQLIDDSKGHTLASASVKELPAKKQNKVSQAEALGQLLAEKAKKAGVKRAVFNKSFYAYHGRVKALADGARKGGLHF